RNNRLKTLSPHCQCQESYLPVPQFLLCWHNYSNDISLCNTVLQKNRNIFLSHRHLCSRSVSHAKHCQGPDFWSSSCKVPSSICQPYPAGDGALILFETGPHYCSLVVSPFAMLME